MSFGKKHYITNPLLKYVIILMPGTTQDKSKVEISQNFVAFSEYVNFIKSPPQNLITMTFGKKYWMHFSNIVAT